MLGSGDEPDPNIYYRTGIIHPKMPLSLTGPHSLPSSTGTPETAQKPITTGLAHSAKAHDGIIHKRKRMRVLIQLPGRLSCPYRFLLRIARTEKATPPGVTSSDRSSTGQRTDSLPPLAPILPPENPARILLS